MNTRLKMFVLPLLGLFIFSLTFAFHPTEAQAAATFYYYANDGTGRSISHRDPGGMSDTTPGADAFDRSCYRITGWNTKADGTGSHYGCNSYVSASGSFNDFFAEWTLDSHGTMTKTEAKAATCFAAGNNAYWTCSDCGGVFSDEAGTQATTVEAQTIAKLSHNMTHHDAVGATCTQEGSIEYWTCGQSCCDGKYFTAEDGSTTTEDITVAKVAHTLTKTNAVEATCTEDGHEAYWTCSVCKKMFSDEDATTEISQPESIPATGHKWDDGEVTKEPSCTQTGEETFTCTVCDETKTEVLAQLAHVMDEGSVTKEPTCTEVGEKTHKCKTCSTVLKTEEIPATGHKLVDHARVEPTATEEGTEEYWECSVCGFFFSDAEGKNVISNPIVIPPTGKTDDDKPDDGKSDDGKKDDSKKDDTSDKGADKKDDSKKDDASDKKSDDKSSSQTKKVIPQTGDAANLAFSAAAALAGVSLVCGGLAFKKY